ncbi:hypothetical protein [Marinobacter sp. CHS3-4]|uniref:hypothetical protein n=1 Tax=Marinobacter sp. CHS3-4 TaxID=3045174 RepID=UPI0024B497CB|nr:hypothetical protein [Marinobacter sp. CHS3-4]MDI9246940.1 hypothetical protein [Marinobacter sp. CHS3-4]
MAGVRILMKKFLPLLFWVSLGCWGQQQPYEVNAFMVKVEDVIPIFKEFETQRVETSFAAFIATVGGQDLNLQFSIEEGKPGFDWVLLAPRNVQDQEKFLEYARRAGFHVIRKSGNGVDYYRASVSREMPPIRVKNSDGSFTELDKSLYLALLCHGILTDMYGLKSESEIGLYAKRVKIGGQKF